jgi:uncharacterized protein (DUF885 family)
VVRPGFDGYPGRLDQGGPPIRSQPEEAHLTDAKRARDLADRYWEGLLEIDPLIATQIGDERFDDRLPDPSDEGVARREAFQREALAQLGGIHRDGLDVSLRTGLDLLSSIARRDLAEIEHRVDRLQAVRHLWGPGQLVADLASMQRADTPERLDRYIARLRAVPAYLRSSAAVAAEGARLGVAAPAIVVERAVAQVERFLQVPIGESPALQPVGDDGARERVIEALRDAVMPAHEDYLSGLRAYLPHATETIGLSFLPGGEGMYDSQILGWTTLPLGAREVHELGVEQLATIQEERLGVARGLGYPSANEAIKDRTSRGENTATEPEQLVRLAEDQVLRSWAAAPAYFGTLPSRNCEVRRIEEFREADMPGAYYQPPTEDGQRPGIYYINCYDLDARPLHQIATTTYHEANPGHHFQIAREQEMTDRPALRRFGGILAGSAFVEGWGLYSERLADEMGLFADDWERLGMLEGQAWRAARLVVDTGIHALGWDRARAVDAIEASGVARGDAGIEVDRYIAMPGQALSYKIGQIEIERWRSAAQEREGPDFSLTAFHDRLLGLGTLPLPSLRTEMGA